MTGKVFHEFGVAATKQNIVAYERGLKTRDDVEYGFLPAFFAAELEARPANVVLVGATFFVGQVGQFEGNDDSIENHGGAETGAEAKEEHAPSPIASKRLHGGVVDEADGLAEYLLVGEVDPSGSEVMRLGERMIVCYRARVADGDAVVLPVFGDGEDLAGHAHGSHVGAGDDFDGVAMVSRGDLNVGASDVDDQNLHELKNTGAALPEAGAEPLQRWFRRPDKWFILCC